MAGMSPAKTTGIEGWTSALRRPQNPANKNCSGRTPMAWTDVEMIRVAANGINFEVATMGSGDKLALCLHGFPEHAYSWRHQMPLLVKLGYRVWAPNLRGYGGTDSPREVSAYKTS